MPWPSLSKWTSHTSSIPLHTLWWGGGRMGHPHCSCHFNSQLLMANGGWVGWDQVLLIAHVTSTLNCWWPMGVWWGGTRSSSLLMSLQLSTADGQWGGVAGEWGSSSSLFMSPQLSATDGQWVWGGGQSSSLLISITKILTAQVTQTLNCWGPMVGGSGGGSSLYHYLSFIFVFLSCLFCTYLFNLVSSE